MASLLGNDSQDPVESAGVGERVRCSTGAGGTGFFVKLSVGIGVFGPIVGRPVGFAVGFSVGFVIGLSVGLVLGMMPGGLLRVFAGE